MYAHVNRRLLSKPLALPAYKRLQPVGVFLKRNGGEQNKTFTWRRPGSDITSKETTVFGEDVGNCLLAPLDNRAFWNLQGVLWLAALWCYKLLIDYCTCATTGECCVCTLQIFVHRWGEGVGRRAEVEAGVVHDTLYYRPQTAQQRT